MKKSLLTFLLISQLALDSGAEVQPTFELDRSNLSVEPATGNISYAGFEQIAISETLSLPVSVFYLELEEGESAGGISILSEATAIGAAGEYVFDPADQVTSDVHNYRNVVSAVNSEQLGYRAVSVDGEVTIAGQRFVRLLVFPVTVNGSTALQFNGRMTIKTQKREFAPHQVINENAFDSLRSEFKIVTGPTSASENANEYLIVTPQSFVPNLDRLSRYKTSTGIQTSVVSIEEVTGESSGIDDAEKLREYLKIFYESGGKYVLLAGDETLLPVRYAYHREVSIAPDPIDLSVCDLYFADLTSDWDVDGDGIYGERDIDLKTLTPELLVGRLPFNTDTEFEHYIDKLIAYETNPGAGQPEYLEDVFFFSADQMRDYRVVGQHNFIAEAYPDNFFIDTISGVEAASGEDLAPTNASARELMPILSEGFGIVNLLSHGRYDAISVRSAGYNEWPKSHFVSQTEDAEHGSFADLEKNGMISFYYSLSCDVGGFDLDQPPMNQGGQNLVQTLLALEAAGAVGFVAYSRWGWVSSSHYLQKSFFEFLFAHPELPAVEAMNRSKAANYYYRDLIYGQNYYGDPTVKIYTRRPERLAIEIDYVERSLEAIVTADNLAVGQCRVIISDSLGIIAEYSSDNDGRINLGDDLPIGSSLTVAAVRTGYIAASKRFTVSIASGIDPSEVALPASFSLSQNYPNPFNPATTISFELPTRSTVELVVFNLLGREVATLLNIELPAGTHQIEWDGRDSNGKDSASGIYFYRLKAGATVAAKKMILLR